MPKLDLDSLEPTNRTGYPAPLDEAVKGRWCRRLGPAGGLSDFNASLVTLEPGAWSSHRHVHEADDELLVMLEGEAVLVEDDGRALLRAGDCAAFPKGGPAHHLINESGAPCRFLCVGVEDKGAVRYPDVDLDLPGPDAGFRHKDGTPYPA